MSFLDHVRWNPDGLVPALAQDVATGRVLTLAWMNRAALSATVASGQAHYWSRSRRRLWKKGESSGHVQTVREVRLDCDRDAVLLLVEQAGGIACHTGRERCFYRRLDEGEWKEVEPVLRDPKQIYGYAGAHAGESGPHEAEPSSPNGERVEEGGTSVGDRAGTGTATAARADVIASLFATIESRRRADERTSYVASLLAGGVDAIAKKIGEEATESVLAAKDGDPAKIVHEIADLWFHCLVMLSYHRLTPEDVLAELSRRHGRSGIAEKASRGG